MSDYLPSELLISIFTRLPVETIGRCSLVCKSWYSLITNPTFISEHLKFNQTAAKDHPHLLVSLYDPKKEIYTLHCDNESLMSDPDRASLERFLVSSRVELYSLSTGEWRNISHLANSNCEVYGHGGLNASVYVVILFDLHDEVFRASDEAAK